MEKKRWVLIFIGLCLALIFSMSPVEAQMHHCEAGNFCDRDGDGFFKNTHQRCDFCIDGDDDKIDCDDTNGDIPDPITLECVEPEPEPTGTILICHFKATIKHCIDEGGGGSLRTIKISQIQHHIDEDTGDCAGEEFLIENLCTGHCGCVQAGGFPE